MVSPCAPPLAMARTRGTGPVCPASSRRITQRRVTISTASPSSAIPASNTPSGTEASARMVSDPKAVSVWRTQKALMRARAYCSNRPSGLLLASKCAKSISAIEAVSVCPSMTRPFPLRRQE